MATRTAGVAEFRATLLWDRVEDVWPGPLLPALPGSVRLSVVSSGEPAEARREILGEVLALTQRDLGAALDAVLRYLTRAAALSDAQLETRVAGMVQPGVTPSRKIQVLAFDLWDAGFPVRFGPSWTPSSGGGVAVGFGGAEAELRRFFGAHPTWEMV